MKEDSVNGTENATTAWNAWLSQRPMELLVWRPSQEKFPNILGLNSAEGRR